MIWKPIGRTDEVNPHGTERAGRPRTSNGDVLRVRRGEHFLDFPAQKIALTSHLRETPRMVRVRLWTHDLWEERITPGFGAYRPTTTCIAASVETCSFTL